MAARKNFVCPWPGDVFPKYVIVKKKPPHKKKVPAGRWGGPFPLAPKKHKVETGHRFARKRIYVFYSSVGRERPANSFPIYFIAWGVEAAAALIAFGAGGPVIAAV